MIFSIFVMVNSITVITYEACELFGKKKMETRLKISRLFSEVATSNSDASDWIKSKHLVGDSRFIVNFIS